MNFPKDKLRLTGILSLVIPPLIFFSLIYVNKKSKLKFPTGFTVPDFFGGLLFIFLFGFPLVVGIALIFRYLNYENKKDKSDELALAFLNVISLFWLFILFVIYALAGTTMRTF